MCPGRAIDCVAVDAVVCELFSGRKFPDNREKYSELSAVGLSLLGIKACDSQESGRFGG